jgi:hypothetical protein
VAVRRYRGQTPPERVAQEARALLDALARAGVATVGAPVSARDDPPSTLPLLRRNEVWVTLFVD